MASPWQGSRSRAPRKRRPRPRGAGYGSRGPPIVDCNARPLESMRSRGGIGHRIVRRSAAEAPRADAELRDRLLERRAREVGPHLVTEHELRVGGLPEQVVRQALLAAGADDQVWIVQVRRVEAAAELVLRAPPKAPGGIEDLPPPPVVEGH